jgi:hypothetical protein
MCILQHRDVDVPATLEELERAVRQVDRPSRANPHDSFSFSPCDIA